MNPRKAVFLIALVALSLGPTTVPAPRGQTSATLLQQSSAPARFAFGGNAAQVPAEFIGNRVFLPVRVNDSQPSLLGLDSSADTSSIDSDRARQLGLRIESLGTSSDPAVMQHVRDAVIGLPGVDLPLASLAVLTKKDFAAQVGRSYEGTLGADFFTRVVVEVDYQWQSVRLYDPAAYHYSGKGTVLPLTFKGQIPLIRAKSSEPKGKVFEADFELNTALDASIVLWNSYSEAHHLYNSHLKTVAVAIPELDGGEKIFIGRLKGIQLGPYVIENPIAAFSRTNSTAGGDLRTAGAIGGGLLRRFTVILDYPHQQLILEPNLHFSEYDEEDKSGLSLIARGPGLKTAEIVQVLPGSPAADAGIQDGDVVAGIDDEPAADLTIASIRDLFRQIGHKHKLLIDRNGQTFQVTIQTRRLL